MLSYNVHKIPVRGNAGRIRNLPGGFLCGSVIVRFNEQI
jgi:hypothetical protein